MIDEDRLRLLDRNMADANSAYIATSELGEIAENRDVRLWCCGFPVPDYNVAFLKVPVRDLAACLAKAEAVFAPRGFPWRVMLRREVAAELETELVDAGFREATRNPGMILTAPKAPAPSNAGLEIRQVTRAEDLERFQATAFRGFGLPPELGAKFITPQFLELPGVRLVLGLVGGEPVCTSAVVMTGDLIGIWWVATLEAFRGRGFGEAITWAAVEAGRALGGTWAGLGASALGRPVYARMGFEAPTEYVHFERPKPE